MSEFARLLTLALQRTAYRGIPLLFLFAGCPPASTPDAGPVDAGLNSWNVVLDQLPGTLLSAWESSDGVLYTVGGTSVSGLVLRHDANGWWQMDPGTSKTLWWVHGFSADDVYAVGAEGVVTHFDGTRWTVEHEGGEYTLFGIWGATRAELLAVGGVVTSSAPRPAVVTKRSGWQEIAVGGLPSDRALFKVWGTSARDFLVVGEGGVAARGEPDSFRPITAPTTQRLTTVHGAGSEIYAVGGLQDPVLLRLNGADLRAVPIPGTPQLLNGVAVNRAGQVVVVGLNGYLAEGTGSSFHEVPSLTRRGLHGVATTRAGFVAVGGELLGAFGQGVILSRGGLAGGEIQAWPNAGQHFDAGVDAGIDAGTDAGLDDGGTDAGFDGGSDAGNDAGVDDAGLDSGMLGPGASCDLDPQGCQTGLSCWFVFGPFKNFCAGLCASDSECGAYGPGACCKLPGPPVTIPVCLPVDAGVCDAG